MRPTPTPEPYVLCAAVYFPDGKMHADQPRNIHKGFVIAGRRHSNCYQVLEMLGINIGQCDRGNEGFLTSHNRFINREEAALLAKKRGQIILIKYTPETLISENLYYP
jgi:hypothetical protein